MINLRTRHCLRIIILSIVGVAFLFPLVITFTNSFMSEQEILNNYGVRLIPQEVTTIQYRTLAEQPVFITQLLNSVHITAVVLFGNLIISLLTAYGFTCWKWKHKEVLFFVYIVVMLMPLQAILVPNFIIADQLGITRTHWAIIFPGIFAPFGTFVLRQTMKSIPTANYEAARLDGAGELSIFLYIVIPQIKSGIAALAILVFIDYWNMVEQAIIFIRDYRMLPLSVFLSRFGDGHMGLIFAASSVYMAFPVIWLIFGQRYLQRGIELSGVK
jgi:multiple sugar transport system permease protein